LIVGLTGGIGAGKSTVAALLARRGAEVIDVDALGRVVLEPDGRAYAGVVSSFGPAILDGSGRIDRAALAGIVFADVEQLDRLIAVSHPAINAELAARIDEVVARRDGAAARRDGVAAEQVIVLDMAILAESNLGRGDPRHSYQTVVTVEAPLELRVERAVARGMAEDEVRRRLAAQATEMQRRDIADEVIVNSDTRVALEAAVDLVWHRLQRRLRAGAGSIEREESST
jgi:dephospho-CoA kinase